MDIRKQKLTADAGGGGTVRRGGSGGCGGSGWSVMAGVGYKSEGSLDSCDLPSHHYNTSSNSESG